MAVPPHSSVSNSRVVSHRRINAPLHQHLHYLETTFPRCSNESILQLLLGISSVLQDHTSRLQVPSHTCGYNCRFFETPSPPLSVVNIHSIHVQKLSHPLRLTLLRRSHKRFAQDDFFSLSFLVPS